LYCYNCGKELVGIGKYCQSCGAKQDDVSTQVNAVAVPGYASSHPTESAEGLQQKLKTTTKAIKIVALIIAVLVVLGGVVLFVINVLPNPQEKVSVAELLDLGEKYLLDMNYEQALVQFVNAIEIEPKNARAYIGAAKAYMGMGDTSSAITVLQRGLAASPDKAEITAMLDELTKPIEPEDSAPVTMDQIVGVYHGANVAPDSHSWIYTISVFESANGTLEAIVDCIADTINNSSSRPGPGAWRSSVDYNTSSNTYSIRFQEWIHDPGWAEETYINCVLSDNGNTLTCLMTATTWSGTINFKFQRVSDTDVSFDYLRPIAQEGSIHFDQWNNYQHRGDFKDKESKTYTGVGMFEPGGGSGTSYVKYIVPASSTRFTSFISLDSVWCGTKSYGTSTFEILLDDVLVFSKSYSETFNAEFVDIPIPQNTKIITLRVQQVRGTRGNHACFFGIPTFL